MRLSFPTSSSPLLNKTVLVLCVQVFIFTGCATHQVKTVEPYGLSANDAQGPPGRQRLRGPVFAKTVRQYRQKVAIAKSFVEKDSHEVVARAREAGLVALPVKTAPAILRELRKDNPVLYFNGPRASSFLIGYEIANDYKLHEIKGGKKSSTVLQEFIKKWEAGDFAAYVFLTPENISRDRNLKRILKRMEATEKIEPKSAAKVYKRLSFLGMEEASLYLALARTAGSPRRSLSFVKKAVHKDPNNFEAWYKLAELQKKTGQEGRARATSRKIIAMFKTKRVSKERMRSLKRIARH